jgi:hypothetical protein
MEYPELVACVFPLTISAQLRVVVVVKGLAHAISRFFQIDLRGILVENLLEGSIIDECKHTLSNTFD